MTRRTGLALVAAVAVVIALGSVAMLSQTSKSRAGAASISTISSQSLVTTTLPSGYQQPASLATAADGSVWFWSESPTEVTLFHWSPTTSTELAQVNLGSPAQLGLVTGI